MSDILAGTVVVVTGASSGIGRAIAVGAAGHGAKAVIVADLDETPREGSGPAVAEIEALGVPARFATTDVSRREQVDALLDLADEFGGVDVMVCGIVGAGFTVAYSTSKGGVVLMVKALGPDGIRVNAVCPGTIVTFLLRNTPDVGAAAEGVTRRTPLRRLGRPEEIADAVAYLGSDLSTYVTGTSLVVDGGLTSVI
jgi:NAD(P)-dependent dehydrogenase (short-subunit alcohol dehydrogenase family)